MINLLLTEQKSELRAARRNVVLFRYTFFLIGVILFMVAIFGIGYLITIMDRNDARTQYNAQQQNLARYNSVKKEAESFEKNLSIAKNILSNEVVFSDLMVRIANTLPPGVVLDGLNVSTDSFGKPIVINARSLDYGGPLSLKAAFEASPLFENVNIASITQSETGDGSRYPVIFSLNATLAKDAAAQSREDS